MVESRMLWEVGLGLLVGVLGTVACSDSVGDTEPELGIAAMDAAADSTLAAQLPPGVTLDLVAQGRALYNSVCVACHGPGGAGTQLGPSLQDDEWIHISGGFDEITSLVHDGVPDPEEYPIPMPVLGGGAFGPAEIRAVSAYVFALRLGAR